MKNYTLKQRIEIALINFLSRTESAEIADMIIAEKEPLHIARRIDEFCGVATMQEKAINLVMSETAQAERV